MQQCSEYMEYQLPNECTRVGYLHEGIQCPDPGLQAAMVSIRTNDGCDGMRNNFEAMAVHILPYDPVSKEVSGNWEAPSCTDFSCYH